MAAASPTPPSKAERADECRVARLGPDDMDAGRELFAVVEDVFERQPHVLSDEYIIALLERPDFWALAAFDRDSIVGGLIAHTLAMTSAARAEVFIYDLAVHPDHQRRGHGRRLISEIRALACRTGIDTVFVVADNIDTSALDFYTALGGTPSPAKMFEFDTRSQA